MLLWRKPFRALLPRSSFAWIIVLIFEHGVQFSLLHSGKDGDALPGLRQPVPREVRRETNNAAPAPAGQASDRERRRLVEAVAGAPSGGGPQRVRLHEGTRV